MLGSTIATALFLARVRTSLATAQQRISLLGWHLRQLLPVDTTGASEAQLIGEDGSRPAPQGADTPPAKR